MTNKDAQASQTEAQTTPDFGEPELEVVQVEPFDKIVVGYFIQWGIYARNYNVWDIPAENISHLLYAFAEVGADNRIAMLDPWADIQNEFASSPLNDQAILSQLDYRGNFAQLALLKYKYPHLKTLISVGGWTKSGRFSDMAATPEGRAAFAESAADFVVQYGFDGVDIDWEYPVAGGLASNSRRPEDRENYTLMIEALRRELDIAETETGNEYLLTAAVSASTSAIENIEYAKVQENMDYIFSMAYDFYVGSASVANHHAPLFFNSEQREVSGDATLTDQYNGDTAVQGYIAAGLDPSKLVLGVPFYGRGWYVEPGVENGMFNPTTGIIPEGTWEAGTWDYDDIKSNYLSGAEVFFDDTAVATYLYNSETGLVISYDNQESIEAKAQYVHDNNLGGMMFWELSQDRDLDLVDPIYRAMR